MAATKQYIYCSLHTLSKKSSSGDEIPERDVTLSSYLFTYLPLNYK